MALMMRSIVVPPRGGVTELSVSVSPCSSGQVACFLIVVAQATFLRTSVDLLHLESLIQVFASRKEPIARDGTSELDEPLLVSQSLQAQLARGSACIASSKPRLFSKPSDTASGVSSSYNMLLDFSVASSIVAINNVDQAVRYLRGSDARERLVWS